MILHDTTITVREEEANGILAAKEWPVRIKMEEGLLIILYEGDALPIPASVQLFLRNIMAEGLTITARVEKMSAFHTIPLPRSALNLIRKRFPFITYKDSALRVELADLFPEGIEVERAEIAPRMGEVEIRVSNLQLPTEILSGQDSPS